MTLVYVMTIDVRFNMEYIIETNKQTNKHIVVFW